MLESTAWRVQQIGTSGHFVTLPWQQNGQEGYQKVFRVDSGNIYVWHKGIRREIAISIETLQTICSAL